jgi:hypothetical protein
MSEVSPVKRKATRRPEPVVEESDEEDSDEETEEEDEDDVDDMLV